MSRPLSARGAVLLVVLITLIMMMALIGAILSLASNQNRAMALLSERHIRNYFRAQAGVVDARERIRLNQTTGLIPAGSFLTATYDPTPYYIDLANDAMHSGSRAANDDVRIDIGARDPVTYRRPIESTGLE